jgi:RNA polymerase-associated protein
MTLYSRGDDPACHCVRIAILEKNLEVRLVEADPGRPPEDLIDLNPYQSVPTLVDRELVVYESRIIVEYLEERFPHPPLLPLEPAGRAQARVAQHRIEHDWYALLPLLQAADRRDRDRGRRLLRESLLAAEALFRARTWFLSEHFSLLDAFIAPILWRLESWEVDVPDSAESITRYMRRAFARTSFRGSLSEREREMRTP